jgi:Glycosyltransferase family 10 (fucosyltransferase) C-term/Fucosyltransferase, N-terminal
MHSQDAMNAVQPPNCGDDRVIILFYNPSFDRWPDTTALQCQRSCEFTIDRSRWREADAVVFHLPTCRGLTRARKFPGQLWVAWCMESEVTTAVLADPDFMRGFDLTMTYQRSSDLWSPYLSAQLSSGLLAPVPAKSEQSPVVLFQSSGYDRSGRNAYIIELMKRVKIDSFGRFLNNRALDIPDAGNPTKKAVVARYKFALAFENSIALDYVTEKFFDALLAGTVPVYRGAPNIEDFAPGDHCYINADRFSGPAELARYLNDLSTDGEAYGQFFAWKQRPLRPQFQRLLEASRTNCLCRLADLLHARRQARAGRDADGGVRPRRPFGVWWRLRRMTRAWGL